jgi:putative hemolysin
MTTILGIVLLFATGITTWLAALAIALGEASESALEERFGDRIESRRWMFGRLGELSQLVGFLRTMGRVAIVLLFVVEWCGFGEAANLSIWPFLAAAASSIAVLWLFTSLLASSLARHAAEGLVVRAAPLLRLVNAVGWPLRRTYRFVDEAVRRLTGANLREAEAEDDLLRSIEDTQRLGGLDEAAAQILENVIAFAETEVASVMTPRTDIEGIERTDDLSTIRAFIAAAGHSRIPVYEGSLDTILGILYVKDLVPYLGTDGAEFRLVPLLREPIRVPETKPVRDLLRDFQRSEVHLAIVIDEYGGTSGLVTIEDLLEEIVGEIHDEHEPESESLPEIEVREDGGLMVDGRYPIEDLTDRIGIEVPEDRDYDTVAGFLLAHFGRVPAEGERFDFANWRFEVETAAPTHIQRVRVDRCEAASPNAGSEEAAAST